MAFYNDPADEFNKRCFRVLIPKWYNPALPAYIKSGEVAPIDTEDLHAMCYSSMSCRFIVDMLFQEVPFTVIEDTSATIAQIVEAYIEEVIHEQFKDKETGVLLDRCKIALLKLNTEVDRGKKHRSSGPKPFRMLNILEQIGIINRKN